MSRDPIRPHTTYLICASPRCGSTLLCEALFRSGLVGKPREAFNPDLEPDEAKRWGVTTYAEFYAHAIADGISPGGVFGTKLMWMYLPRVTANLRPLFGPHPSPLSRLLARATAWFARGEEKPDPQAAHETMAQVLAHAFPNLHYVWITRRDKVRQAVSLHRALQTNIWLQTDDALPASPPPATQPVFDFQRIDSLLHNVVIRNDVGWQHYFAANGIEPYTVVYEDLVQDDEGVALDIVRHLGVSVPADHTFARRILRKQADGLSEQWVQQYHEMKRSSGVPALE